MRKNVASTARETSSLASPVPMLNGHLNPEFFRYLQNLYREKTGYGLVLSDVNGSIQMGLPDCEKFPCFKTCRECREQIVSEALRTGKVCVDTCHDGYVLWGLPLIVQSETVGGLIVIGGEHDLREHKVRFEGACRSLYHLMQDHHLLPDHRSSQGERLADLHRFVFRDLYEKVSKVLQQHGDPFLDGLQTAEFKVAEAHFAKIRKAFREGSDLPTDLLKGLVGDLIFRARRQFVEAGMDGYACCSEAGLLMEKIAGARNSLEIEVILEAFFERFILLSKQRPKDPDDLLIEKATSYLERHIRDPLSRESVAKAVGISPSHFSRLIHEKKGRTFTDLLNQYRIERACKLLVRSSHSLAEIASETGFCDQSYFSKVFRRYKALTPARYREVHKL